MKMISLPLIAVLALVFVPLSLASSQAGSPHYTLQPQNSRDARPYIGPFYPYPQVPLGCRNVSMEDDEEFWFLVSGQ